MVYQLVLSPVAIEGIDQAFEYYNRLSSGLGFEFTDTVDRYLQKITLHPSSSSIRYDNVRVKPIDVFPFTIHFIVDDNKVIVLRIFNTYQQAID